MRTTCTKNICFDFSFDQTLAHCCNSNSAGNIRKPKILCFYEIKKLIILLKLFKKDENKLIHFGQIFS